MSKARIFNGDNAYKQERYDKGLCTWCNTLRDSDNALCARCRLRESERQKERRQQRKAARLCTRCKSPIEASVTGLKCLKCWFQHVAIVSLNDWTKGESIAALFFSQQGKCAYSDEQLLPGVNACLDHKIPRSRGGSNELDNIHWVTKDINRTKGKLTHDEFVSLCQYVVTKYTS